MPSSFRVILFGGAVSYIVSYFSKSGFTNRKNTRLFYKEIFINKAHEINKKPLNHAVKRPL